MALPTLPEATLPTDEAAAASVLNVAYTTTKDFVKHLKLLVDIARDSEKLGILRDLDTKLFKYIQDHMPAIMKFIEQAEAAEAAGAKVDTRVLLASLAAAGIAVYIGAYSHEIAAGYQAGGPLQALHSLFRTAAPYDYKKPDEGPRFITKALPLVGVAGATASLYFDVAPKQVLSAAAVLVIPGIYNACYPQLRDDIEIMMSIERMFHRQFALNSADVSKIQIAMNQIDLSVQGIAAAADYQAAEVHVEAFKSSLTLLLGALGSRRSDAGLIPNIDLFEAAHLNLQHAEERMANIRDSGSERSKQVLANLNIQLRSAIEHSKSLVALLNTDLEIEPGSAIEHIVAFKAILDAIPAPVSQEDFDEIINPAFATFRDSEAFRALFTRMQQLKDLPPAALANGQAPQASINQMNAAHQANADQVSFIQNWLSAAALALGAGAVYAGFKAVAKP